MTHPKRRGLGGDPGALLELADAQGAVLLRALVGHADPGRLAASLQAAMEPAVGIPVRCFFAEVSVGLVAGLERADGRPVVAKVHGSRTGRDALEAIARLQEHLRVGGFPVPGVLAGPLPLERGHLMIEELRSRGERGDPRRPAQRSRWAAALHELIERLEAFVELPGLPHEDAGSALWPEPHNALFDFEGTNRGAEPIDGVAREAVATGFRDLGRRVVGHADWSAKHYRIEGDRITAIYDWDSLRVSREPMLVGAAAASFTVSWYLDDPPHWPRVDEALAFVREYERARGRPFDARERLAVAAAARYAAAYQARCAHALGEGYDRSRLRAFARECVAERI